VIRSYKKSLKRGGNKLAIPHEKFIGMLNKLPNHYQKNLHDYMEYLIQKSAREHWQKFPRVSEPLNDEERQQLNEKREYLTGKEAKSEFNFPIDLP
jgi:hypothetical protein